MTFAPASGSISFTTGRTCKCRVRLGMHLAAAEAERSQVLAPAKFRYIAQQQPSPAAAAGDGCCCAIYRNLAGARTCDRSASAAARCIPKRTLHLHVRPVVNEIDPLAGANVIVREIRRDAARGFLDRLSAESV